MSRIGRATTAVTPLTRASASKSSAGGRGRRGRTAWPRPFVGTRKTAPGWNGPAAEPTASTMPANMAGDHEGHYFGGREREPGLALESVQVQAPGACLRQA